jgi:zinc transport system ATP-binding protein
MLVTAIQGLVEKGACVIMITHELGIFENDVDRAIVLSAGGVSFDGPVTQLPAQLENSHHSHPHSKPTHLMES